MGGLEGGSPHIFLSKSAQNCTEKCEGGWAFGALQCEGGRCEGAIALRGLLQHQAFTSQNTQAAQLLYYDTPPPLSHSFIAFCEGGGPGSFRGILYF